MAERRIDGTYECDCCGNFTGKYECEHCHNVVCQDCYEEECGECDNCQPQYKQIDGLHKEK